MIMLEKICENKNFFTETILLSAIPIVAYGFAYFFESGYLSKFGLPDFIITISIERFFYALSVFLFIIPGIFNLIDTLFEVGPAKETWAKFPFNGRMIAFFIFFLSLPVITIFLHFSGGHVHFLSYLLGITGLAAIFFVFVLPYFSSDNFLDYTQKMHKRDEEDRAKARKSLTYKIVSKIGVTNYFIILCILIILPLSAFLAGRLVAESQKNYLTANIELREYALIRMYSDMLVFVEIQKKWVSLYNQKYVFKNSYLLVNPEKSLIDLNKKNMNEFNSSLVQNK